eukprot:10327931-Alexandrium_andersonii.AAC.1
MASGSLGSARKLDETAQLCLKPLSRAGSGVRWRGSGAQRSVPSRGCGPRLACGSSGPLRIVLSCGVPPPRSISQLQL